MQQKKYNNVLDHIGWTPLVPIRQLNTNRNVQILAKLESFNPGGSTKDRPAFYMIEEAERTGALTKEKIILEATSGNTGIGLSLVAAVKGYRILLVMSEAASEERKKILKAMGADLQFTPAHMGTDGSIEFAYTLAREEPLKFWLADQFNNDANWLSHYHGTAEEIWEQTGGDLDMIVASMGTTGTLMGLSRRFKEVKPAVQIVGVEPYMGHKIQGLKNMKESYPPGIYDRKRADRIVHIDDGEAYETARLLAKKEGLFVGMSAGAAMAAALRLAREMKEGRIVVILPDGGERYLSTPLFVARKTSGLCMYNTLTRRKDAFVPLQENRVTLYSCGPTLCQDLHIGQARQLVFSDLVRRTLESKGYEVTQVVNVTDIDDRTIEGAEKEGVNLKEFTERYYQEFLRDLDSLLVKKATAYPKASEHIEDMIQFSGKLLDKGYAYEKFRSLYFDISRFRDYGKLSRIDLDKIHLGKTVDLERYEKGNPRDFTLLKRSTLSELKKGIFFQTKWGNVRPSWHLECPVMAIKFLGDTHDIHTGGADLVFPHHENAIALGRALTGKPLASYFLHHELVMVDGKKPADGKEREDTTIKNLLKRGYTGREIRYWLISHHYNKPISFSLAKLDNAKKTLSNLDKFVKKVFFCRSGDTNPEVDQVVYNLNHKFTEAMDDDLNTSQALAALFEFTREVHRIVDQKGLSPEDKQRVEEALRVVNSVLEIMDLNAPQADEAIEALIQKRETARKAKDWETSDRIRQELGRMGIEVTDTRDGTIWRRDRDSNPR
ncbi:MAG: cysteine--tRNA ligase [Deltaproteobacteria bacterium]|nr:cysteine--tRNA ligase [Deltaproteobacteria bacterium]NTV56102.1 cysteine--tRNA ligase [Deltaproteobacteria bacterium]